MQQNMRPITKPDINSVFESMLAIPADVRAQHINAYLLTGSPEQKLAAAMIKDMPQGQAPSGPVQAPTQTIINQKLAQVDPGIAALPVAEGMFSENSYAGGGIIAFDEGGDIPSFAGPQGSDTSSWYERQIANPISDAFSGIEAYGERQGKLSELRMQRQRLSQGLGIGPGMNIFKQESDPERQSRLQQIAALDQQIETLSSGSAPAVKPAASTIKGNVGLNKDDIAKAGADTAKNYVSDQGNLNKNKNTNVSGIKALTYTDIKPNTAGYAALNQTEQTPAQYMKERNDLIGPDENKEANKNRLATMEAKTNKMEEQASALALAKFGFGFATAREGQEFDAINKSAISALDDLSSAKEKVQAAREKQFDIASRQAQADRAEKVAAADYGLNSSKHIKAENRAVTLAELNNKNELDLKNAENQLRVQQGNAEIEMSKAKLAQEAAQHKQTIEMYDKRIASTDRASAARLLAVRANVIKNLANDPGYTQEVNQLNAQYKDDLNNPLYAPQLKLIRNKYIAEGLGSALESIGDVPTAESYGAQSYGAQ
jgi:hypothetical protein